MKIAIVFATLCAVALALPAGPDDQTVRFDQENGVAGYKFA